MESEPASQAQVNAESLPPHLVAQLAPKARDALSHPLRRQILRTLNGSAEPRTASEIAAAGLPHASISVISYHAQVLESCDSVAMSGARQDRGAVGHLYASKVAGDEKIAAVLEATRGVDRWRVDPR